MKPEDHDQDEIRDALQEAFPEAAIKLRRDLWPAMRQRIATSSGPVPWYDWALAVCLVAAVFLFPKFILLIAYHL